MSKFNPKTKLATILALVVSMIAVSGISYTNTVEACPTITFVVTVKNIPQDPQKEYIAITIVLNGVSKTFKSGDLADGTTQLKTTMKLNVCAQKGDQYYAKVIVPKTRVYGEIEAPGKTNYVTIKIADQ